MKYKLVKAVYIDGQVKPEVEVVLPEDDMYGIIAIFNPDCKKCEECTDCTPDIKYFAVPDENGDLTIDEVNDLKKKGLEAFRHRQMLKNKVNEYEILEQ